MSFDPWTATEKEAMFEYLARIDAGETETQALTAVWQQDNAAQVNAQRSAIESGDGLAVLACIRTILTGGLVAPEWLVLAYSKRYDNVQNFAHMSWDDAFGKPHPPNTQQFKERRAWLYPILIRQAIDRELATTNLSLSKIIEKLAPVFMVSKSGLWNHYQTSIKRFGKVHTVKRRYNRR